MLAADPGVEVPQEEEGEAGEWGGGLEGGECCVEVEEGLKGGGGRRVHGKESEGEARGPGEAVGCCAGEKLVFWG